MAAAQRAVRFVLNGRPVTAAIGTRYNLIELLQQCFGLFGARESCGQGLAKSFAAQAPADGTASIVNILDQRVYRQIPRFFSYGLTKSALFAATGMLAQALAPNVRVNAVAPGPTLRSERQTAQDFTRQQRALPLRRGPDPQRIADAIPFLAGAHSITGETIGADGGRHLSWQTADDADICVE